MSPAAPKARYQREFSITKQIEAVAYLRVSTPGQVDGDGLDRQRDAIAAHAAKASMTVVAEFEDAGISGTRPLGERPGLTALFAKIMSNGVRVVLVEKADRLARDLVEGELLLREFRKADVRVVEIEGGHDLTAGDDENPTAKLIRQVLGAVSEFEKSALVAKLRAARDRKRRETGRCEGARPYGELPGEDVGLQRVLALAKKPRGKPRRSLREIVAVLNEEAVPTRTGVPWSVSSVQSVLRRHGKR